MAQTNVKKAMQAVASAERQTRILRLLALGPRQTPAFTHTDSIRYLNDAVNPGQLEGWLEDLKRRHMVTEKAGEWRITARGRMFLDSHVEFEPPSRVTNSSSKDPYVPPTWNVRAAAAAQVGKFKSRGTPC